MVCKVFDFELESCWYGQPLRKTIKALAETRNPSRKLVVLLRRPTHSSGETVKHIELTSRAQKRLSTFQLHPITASRETRL